MNCLDFRREKLADPRCLSEGAQAHVDECPTCAAFAREVDGSERALDRALQTPVPEGLADRIIFRSRRPRPAWRVWALAASIVLSVALGFFLSGLLRNGPDLYARLAIEHVVMEPESLITVRNADPEAFRAAVQSFGGTLNELPGKVRYIRLCPVEDGFGWHIVFETPDGSLATLILVPGKQMPRLETASAGGWSALARPVRGGYYAIVTPSAAATSSFDKMLRECVIWDA
jgi:hypothetical protein